MMPGIEVRPAGPGDADVIWPLARELATSAVLERAAFERVHAVLTNADDSLVLVAESAACGLVGYLTARLWPAYRANGPVAWVDELMVVESMRRCGVGRALMGRAEDWARGAGAQQVALATRRAAPFYRALGYEVSAEYLKKPLD